MKAEKKATIRGLVMMVSFVVVLAFLFMPVFNGHNTMEFLDNLYNSISKGSADYAGAVKEEITGMEEEPLTVQIEMASPEQARQSALLLNAAGAATSVNDKTIKMDGKLKEVLMTAIDDSKIMFNNEGEVIKTKYGYNERLALYNWWVIFNKIENELTGGKRFESAKKVSLVQSRVIECSYNYYGIEAQSIKDKYFVVIFSLLFYVIYTVWYGFGIMYLFEGFGMKLGH
jgi:hypothetical protein